MLESDCWRQAATRPSLPYDRAAQRLTAPKTYQVFIAPFFRFRNGLGTGPQALHPGQWRSSAIRLPAATPAGFYLSRMCDGKKIYSFPRDIAFV